MRIPSIRNLKISKKQTIATIIVLIAAIAVSAVISSFGQNAEKPAIVQDKEPIEVEVRSFKDSNRLKQVLEFPATVDSNQEAKLIAKTSGNIVQSDFKVGDRVNLGDLLVRIDDVKAGSRSYASGYSADQVRQAQIAARTAEQSYRLAETNFSNLLITSSKDIEQAEIARKQAAAGRNNLSAVTEESLKSARLSYETARTAAEQARLNLENRKKQISQSVGDTDVNVDTTADTVINSCETIVTGINTLVGFDLTSGLSIPYMRNLGAADSRTYTSAYNAYYSTVEKLKAVESASYPDSKRKIEAAIEVAGLTKRLADSAKQVVSNSVASIELPQSSLTGVSLSSLTASMSGYQSQASGLITQANAAKQGLENLGLNNDTTAVNLEKAYELAKKQEEQARQALENLKAGNKSQQDQADYGLKSADKQLESARARIDAQVSVARSQVELARLQYQNAVTAMQSLVDIHQAVAPISGTITQKYASKGETVSPGQVLAVISQTERTKLTFFIDQANLQYVSIGQPAAAIDADGTRHPSRITTITPQADSATKRYKIEAEPLKSEGNAFRLGSVISINIEITKSAKGPGSAILPLAAIEVTQNENYVFIIKDEKAEKMPVTIERVEGETAEIKGEFKADSMIIIEGGKLLHVGDPVRQDSKS